MFRLVKVWKGIVVYGCFELLSHRFCGILRMMISNGCLVIIIIHLFQQVRFTVIRIHRRYTDYIIIAVFRNHINYITLSNHIPLGFTASDENNLHSDPLPLQVATESTREFVTSVSPFGGISSNSDGVGGGGWSVFSVIPSFDYIIQYNIHSVSKYPFIGSKTKYFSQTNLFFNYCEIGFFLIELCFVSVTKEVWLKNWNVHFLSMNKCFKIC